ncbi:FAD-binding oxidoreductase [Litorimonas haliclonae]|uniref:FAD-binding oxidoreductase n=1 Tax=Litorimonas haliclonae TaxID=2081977 RepID=UPI0039EF58CF
MSQSLDTASLDTLKQIVGAENFSQDEGIRALFSQDIWAKGETADFVVSPENTEQLAHIIGIGARKKMAFNPRGAGMSYTKGYIPNQKHTAIIDFSKMDKILEINEDDMYVTVQAGCSWKTLYEALKPLGLRTPFWGPLSGYCSTIGGGVSQNNAFFGASTHGSSIDSVTSMTVVLADGSVIKTGTASSPKGKPFFRQYGPDLTGLFLSDAGALGYKAEITLRLIPLPEAESWASFEYDNRDGWAQSLAEAGRLGLACELFGFDPNLQAVRMKRASLAADFKTLGNVVKGQKGGLLKGLKEGAKIAMAGRSYMDDVAYSLHWTIEGHSDEEIRAKMKTLKDIAKKNGGREIENSIPKIMRSNPFTPLNNILGPQGERWVPIHGVVPMGDGKACIAKLDALFESLKEEIEKYEIMTGYLMTTLSNNGYLIEPVFIWPEEIFQIHKNTVEPSVRKRIKQFEKNPDATAIVEKARQGILDIFTEFGAAHLQIGRTYPYRDNMDDATKALLDGVKHLVDPANSVNSGSLGFPGKI